MPPFFYYFHCRRWVELCVTMDRFCLAVQDGDEDERLPVDQDSDNDRADNEANPLMVPLEEEPTLEELSTKWFSQDVFDEADDELVGDVGKFDSEDEMKVDEAPKQLRLPKGTKKNDMQVDKQVEPSTVTAKNKKNRVKEVQPSKKTEDDFEIVPAPATDSSDDSSSDESDDDDVETKAEILAYAKKMLGKKHREQMLDDAYNKYMFHDTGLPNWFEDEEKKHRQLVKPITKEEVAAMRAQFKAIDARSSKKVLQAKARKKRVAMRQLEKVRKKANTISDQADISDRSKSKMIESLYKKATPKRPQKEYVVAKKGVQVKVGKGKVLVDRRMKKDARAQDKKGKGNLKKGKGGQKGKGSGKGGQKGKGDGMGSAKGKSGYKGRKVRKG